MDKSEIYKFTRILYRKLRDSDFIFKIKRLTDCQGLITTNDNGISVAFSPNCQFIPTIIHEVLHAGDMALPEKKVMKLERYIMSQLSHKQMVNILLATAKALKRDVNK